MLSFCNVWFMVLSQKMLLFVVALQEKKYFLYKERQRNAELKLLIVRIGRRS